VRKTERFFFNLKNANKKVLKDEIWKIGSAMLNYHINGQYSRWPNCVAFELGLFFHYY
jgi:hypothetical protein